MGSFQIKQEDKFFSRLLSRDGSSAVSSSRRVYYGGTAASVPFLWETCPGTPKHAFYDNALPPLTPPPSYHQSRPDWAQKRPKRRPSSFLSAIFPALAGRRKAHWAHRAAHKLSSSSSSVSSSSSSSYSSSSALSSPSADGGNYRLRQLYMSRSVSPPQRLGYGMGSPNWTLCFRGGGSG